MINGVHDILAHLAGSFDFSGRGEVAAYNRHAATVPPAALPALFTEVVGQSAVTERRGYFPEQKIAILPGFDYRRLGYMDTTSRIRPHRRESRLKHLLAHWWDETDPANVGEYGKVEPLIEDEDPKTGHRLVWEGGHGIKVFDVEDNLQGYICTGDPGESPEPSRVKSVMDWAIRMNYYHRLRPSLNDCEHGPVQAGYLRRAIRLLGP